MRQIFVSPHNDDATLFGAFTCIAVRPLVVTVYDSYVQPKRIRPILGNDAAVGCGAFYRRKEDAKAMLELGCEIEFVGLRDDTEYLPSAILEAVLNAARTGDVEVWAPLEEEGGHDQHNLVARAFDGFPVHRYTTYTRAGGRTKIGERVDPCDTSWVLRKLRALACYESQINIAQLGCWPWFMGDQAEYRIMAKR